MAISQCHATFFDKFEQRQKRNNILCDVRIVM